ncbi:MAG: hypothetical protein ABIS36_17015 [Chryseolinea sp.]
MDRIYLSQYRDLVCRKFMIGEQSKLRQREFEYLADQIEQSSGIRLSISTLKRIWREHNTQLPHVSTLNALVSVLGYVNWVDFKQAQVTAMTAIRSPTQSTDTDERESVEAVVSDVPEPIKSENTRRQLPKLWLSIVPLVLIGGFLFVNGFVKPVRKKLELPAVIPFTADKTVTSGVPNTVQFKYDVSGIRADSFFIQQSWDPRNKIRVDPAKQYFSSIYYLPGFHRAKLIVNDTVVAKARIHIKTDGWFGVAEYDQKINLPLYPEIRRAMSNGKIHIAAAQLKDMGMDLTKPFQLRYYNIRDFDDITSDYFTLETRVKSDSSINVACPLYTAVLVTEEHIFFYPLTLPGCVGELVLKSGEVYHDARETDLSAFGCNVYDWQTLKVENSNRSTRIFLNEKLIHEIAYKKDFGKIVGLILSFNGPAAVDEVKLWNKQGKEIFADAFDNGETQ